MHLYRHLTGVPMFRRICPRRCRLGREVSCMTPSTTPEDEAVTADSSDGVEASTEGEDTVETGSSDAWLSAVISPGCG